MSKSNFLKNVVSNMVYYAILGWTYFAKRFCDLLD